MYRLHSDRCQKVSANDQGWCGNRAQVYGMAELGGFNVCLLICGVIFRNCVNDVGVECSLVFWCVRCPRELGRTHLALLVSTWSWRNSSGASCTANEKNLYIASFPRLNTKKATLFGCPKRLQGGAFWLIWSNLIWFGLIWFDLVWSNLIWSDLI